MICYYSDTFVLPLPPGHRFPMEKYRRLREQIMADRGLPVRLCVPAPATREQLRLVHADEYLDRVFEGRLSPLEIRRIGFPWSTEMVHRSQRSTGATIAAATTALVEHVACNLAGGTHHAFPTRGQGYCVFNDTCVAARWLQHQHGVGNVLFVDCDVHQGNGTAAVAADDPTLFSLSVHCDRNYPFEKTPGDLDVELPAGTGDAEYLQRLESALNSVLATFQPQIAFYLAGADPYEGDRLGLLGLTKEGLRLRDELVIKSLRARKIPVVVCMAGGYAPDVRDIVDIHHATVQVAFEHWMQANRNGATLSFP